MTSATYLKYTFLFAISFVAIVVLTNFIVDPKNIYPNFFPQNYKMAKAEYIAKLLNSEYGMPAPGMWSERSVKKSLAQHPIKYDCAIIGSSHIMQISSFRKNKSLVSICPSMKNLGVSGGTLEDYLSMSNIIIKNSENLPRTIVFGIDPWALNFAKDSRWIDYKEDYIEMKNTLSVSAHVENDVNPDTALVENLFNMQYFKRSLETLFESNVNISPVNKFNYEYGTETAITLPDGSHVYDMFYIKNAVNSIKSISGRHDYKMRDGVGHYQNHAVDLMVELVQYLKNKKIDIVFVLTPYHHKVWNFTEQKIVERMVAIENKVHELAKRLKITVIGSYSPFKIGCKENEFYDGMHAKSDCLMKLESVFVRN